MGLSELAHQILDLPKMQAMLDALRADVNQEITFRRITILTSSLMAGTLLLRFK